MISPVKKAVIPVAGPSEGLLPLSKAIPRGLLPVHDRPLVQYAVEEAFAAGLDEAIIVAGQGRAEIENHFAHCCPRFAGGPAPDGTTRPVRIAFASQDRPAGPGNAILCAREHVGQAPFAVILADDLLHSPASCLGRMLDAHAFLGGNMVALMEVEPSRSRRYGIAVPGVPKGGIVPILGLVEKPRPEVAPSNLAIVGRYLLDPSIFDILDHMATAKGSASLTEALAAAIGVVPLNGHRFDGIHFDCGDRIGFLTANIALGLMQPEVRREVENFLHLYREQDIEADPAPGEINGLRHAEE